MPATFLMGRARWGAHAVRGVELAPAMPAQHRRGVDQIDAPDRGIEAGVEEAFAALDQRLQRIGGRFGIRVDGARNALRHLLEHRLEEIALVIEVIVERAARHLGTPHDLLGCRGLVPLSREELARFLEQDGARGGQPFGLCARRGATGASRGRAGGSPRS